MEILPRISTSCIANFFCDRKLQGVLKNMKGCILKADLEEQGW